MFLHCLQPDLTCFWAKKDGLKIHDFWPLEVIFEVKMTSEVKTDDIFGILSSRCIIWHRQIFEKSKLKNWRRRKFFVGRYLKNGEKKFQRNFG